MRKMSTLSGMRRRFVIGAGGGALALVMMGSLVFGSAFAQTTSTPDNAATPEAGTGTGGQTANAGLYQDFIGKLASNLGISDTASVDTAIRTTLKQMVDEQQAAGRLSAAQANALKERIDAGDFPRDFAGIGAFGRQGKFDRGERGNHRGGGRGEMRGGMMGANLQQLATFFGESPADLRAELDQGMSLVDIAAAHGKTEAELKTFLMNQAETRIDAIINAGSSNGPSPSTNTPAATGTPSV